MELLFEHKHYAGNNVNLKWNDFNDINMTVFVFVISFFKLLHFKVFATNKELINTYYVHPNDQ